LEDGKRIKLKDLFVEWDTKTMHNLEKMPLGQELMLMVASYNMFVAADASCFWCSRPIPAPVWQSTPNLRQHRFI
jgi:hypothetical protein